MGDALPRLCKPSVGSAPSKSPAPGIQISIGRLPVTSRDLFGREKELAWLDACWSDGVRVASVVAWGGVGKSALVNTWLRRLDADGWRGARRVFGWSFYSQGTERLGSSDEFFAAALREFGDEGQAPTSPWEKGERLAKLVRRERALVILDGLEPLQWGPGVQEGRLRDLALTALLKELGAQNAGMCLITSRIGVTDLDAFAADRVQEQRLDDLEPKAGSELLRARGVKGEEEELREASREYKGHAFALTLLGSYLRRAHGGEIRERHEIPPIDDAPAERMFARYEHWFEGQPELAILRLLGFFDRPASADEIGALLADPPITGLTDALSRLGRRARNEAVVTLRDVGLLAGADGDAGQLDAHPLVRAHFGERLRRVQPEAWKEGHRRLYEYLKAQARPEPDTVEEMAPLYAAVVHGCLAGEAQDALDEVYKKRILRDDQEAYSVHKLGDVERTLAVLSAFFDPPWERLVSGIHEDAWARIMNDAGYILRAVGQPSTAVPLLKAAVQDAHARRHAHSGSIRTSNLGEIHYAQGELGAAEVAARESVRLADACGEGFERVSNRMNLAAVLHAQGRVDEATALFEEAEQIRQSLDSPRPLRYRPSTFQLRELLLDRGRVDDAMRDASSTLGSAERERWLLDFALDHLSLGRAHLLAAHRAPASIAIQDARDHLRQALHGLRRAGYQEHVPLGLLARASLHLHTGALDDARRDLTEALALSTRCGFRLHECDAHIGFACLALAEHQPDAARAHLAEARALIADTGYHRRDAELADLEDRARVAAPAP